MSCYASICNLTHNTGDCDRDADCDMGLVCMERYDDESIPGCSGIGVKGKDYCILPELEPTPDPTSRPTVGVVTPAPSPMPTIRRTPAPTMAPPTTPPTPPPIRITPRPTMTPPTTPPPVQQPTEKQDPQLSFIGVCDETLKCGVCQGECFADEDCQTGLLCFQREGFTAVPACSGYGAPSMNFCYKPETPVLYGTGDCSAASPCRMCQGKPACCS